jgi:integrase
VIARNVARGKGRKLASVEPRRTWIDRADHLRALLDGASELDGKAYVRKGQRRALLAVLAFAGLRLGEALELTWRDVNLARGTIEVRDGKTAAAARRIYVLPALHDELASYRARLDPEPHELVFETSNGTKLNQTNIRLRLLAPAIEKANERPSQGRARPPAGRRQPPLAAKDIREPALRGKRTTAERGRAAGPLGPRPHPPLLRS